MHGFLDRFARDVFTPATVQILTAAFDDAWNEVTSSNAPWARPEYAETARTILAKYIIAAARDGIDDRRALMDGALMYLSRQKLSRMPPDPPA